MCVCVGGGGGGGKEGPRGREGGPETILTASLEGVSIHLNPFMQRVGKLCRVEPDQRRRLIRVYTVFIKYGY